MQWMEMLRAGWGVLWISSCRPRPVFQHGVHRNVGVIVSQDERENLRSAGLQVRKAGGGILASKDLYLVLGYALGCP